MAQALLERVEARVDLGPLLASLRRVRRAQDLRHLELLRPTVRHAVQAALDQLDAILEEPDSVATFTLQRGEMLWVDNTTTLHDRTAYEDDPNAPRLLLRQWVVG